MATDAEILAAVRVLEGAQAAADDATKKVWELSRAHADAQSAEWRAQVALTEAQNAFRDLLRGRARPPTPAEVIRGRDAGAG